MTSIETPRTFTGRPRRRGTRFSVRLADRVARTLIAVGGIGTIVAVSMVCIFLVWTAVPLFFPASLGEARRVQLAQAADTNPTATKSSSVPLTDTQPRPAEAKTDGVRMAVDEYLALGWTISADAVLRAFRLDDGSPIGETTTGGRALFSDRRPTCSSYSIDSQKAAFGFADGSIVTGTIGFSAKFIEPQQLPKDLAGLEGGESATWKDGLLTHTAQGPFRWQKVQAELAAPLATDSSSAVRLIDCSWPPTGMRCCTLTDDGKLTLRFVRQRRNLMADAPKPVVTTAALPYAPSAERGPPSRLLLSGLGESVYLAWDDGRLMRFDTHDLAKPRVAEQIDLVPESGETLTALTFTAGKTTLVAGDSSGRIRAWFRTKPADATTVDGATLVAAHVLVGPQSPVVALAPSSRSRLLAAGYADGQVRAYYLTNERELVETQLPGGETISALCLAPKDNGIVALARATGALANESQATIAQSSTAQWTVTQWPLDASYAEVTPSALFRPVWYEGYESPQHVWQSSGGTDDFEPKLGLMPLVFGTAKATVYSLLFAVPLALFAALYTSEFLHPGTKARIKPVIEMMASLPSVVLGFLAGVVFAPLVEGQVSSVLAAIAVIPLTLLASAYLWQLLPQRWTIVLARWRFVFICMLLPVGVWLSYLAGPVMERLLFAGDLRAWLDGAAGGSAGGWTFLILPLCAIGVVWFISRSVNPWLRQISTGWSRGRWAVVDLSKFVVGVVLVCIAAWGAGLLLQGMHLDPRGSLLGTYVQRNALVVGFVMGFAIIPLIYTIADDALSTVPKHLRSASLGAGATPWQTATRIIVPAAASGLFSAVMIGLGRAVGETMIVLMAAGNTPILDWNIFNGFQTLSANIATELPEAVQGSSHFRTLFVAALALFAMTFVVNTVAEIVRLRFRRRAYEL